MIILKREREREREREKNVDNRLKKYIKKKNFT